MSGIRQVTPGFSVAGQLSREDIARAAAAGFRTLVNNRPDREARDQLSDAEARAAASKAGLAYHFFPFAGPPPPGVVAETADLLEQAQAPVLAYCRTGTRSITAWAMAQALTGAQRPEAIIDLANGAGYDLSGAREALDRLAPKA